MKKFLVLFHDKWEMKPEVMEAWQTWFANVGDQLVDSGNPFAAGVEVTHSGSRELSNGDGAATGYSIISAETREDAEQLLAGCPFSSSVRLYEASAM
jgi:hypothetical protein